MAETTRTPNNPVPDRKSVPERDEITAYDKKEETIALLTEYLRSILQIEPAVQLSLVTPLCNAERSILAIPFELDRDSVLRGFAQELCQRLSVFRFPIDPKTSLPASADPTLEDRAVSVLRRETEELLLFFRSWPDTPGEHFKNVPITGRYEVPKPGKGVLSKTIRKGLDIRVGYRIVSRGGDTNRFCLFFPLKTGKKIIDYVYYNIANILHHNFIAYDESSDSYLTITEPLVFKEIETLLRRSKKKEVTRRRMLDGLQYNTMFASKPQIDPVSAHDSLYDPINQIQNESMVERSVALHATLPGYSKKMSKLGRSKSKKRAAETIPID